VVRRLLRHSKATVFNLDKCGYASDLGGIEQELAGLGPAAEGPGGPRHQLLRVDLVDGAATAEAVRRADPDLVLHLAAESHVDRSIDGPGAFIESNVTGTFHLLQAVRAHWEQLPTERRDRFRFHHIGTDEVFGSLGPEGRFSETTPRPPLPLFGQQGGQRPPGEGLAPHLRPAGGADQLQQQLRPLAVP
jgi:dTDP-glucose 4,6-dehydratase